MAEEQNKIELDKKLLRQAILEYVMEEEQPDKLSHLIDTINILLLADTGNTLDSEAAPLAPHTPAESTNPDDLPPDLESYVDSLTTPEEPESTEDAPVLVREEMKHSPYLSDFVSGKGVRPLSIKNMDKMLSRMGFKSAHRKTVERKAKTLGFTEHQFWNYLRMQSLATLTPYGEIKEYLRVRKVVVPKVVYQGSQTFLERFSRLSLWAAYDRATMDIN